jgi:hypothetical protein
MPDNDVNPDTESLPKAADYDDIVDRLKNGSVVPFFGAGASIGCGNLPSGRELAERIALKAQFPDPDEYGNLALVASYLVHINSDSLGLDALLREIFNVVTEAAPLHRCIASLNHLRLVVTTNYDDLIERALEARWVESNSEMRKPWILVDRGTPGIVWYREPGKPWVEAESKNLGDHLVDPPSVPGQERHYRPILFKMHGSVDREDREQDWFLITEEHYVDFLGRPDNSQIPPMLMKLMRNRNFLFLGYGLRDWNIRVMLRKLMLTRNPAQKVNSWAVVKKASVAEKRLWGAHGVKIFEVDLQTFAEELQARL